MQIHGSLILTSLFALALAGCDNSGGTDVQNPSSFIVTPPPAPAGGIWTGTLGGAAALAVITEEGKFHLIDLNGQHYFGQMSVSPVAMTATFLGVAPVTSTFPDGSETGSGVITAGSVSARDAILGTFSFTTANGTTTTSTLTLAYEKDLYETSSSLASVTGLYGDGATVALEVTTTGLMSYIEAGSGCQFSGTIDTLDTRFNLYQVRYVYSGCGPAAAQYNGQEFSGVAVVDDTGTEPALIFYTATLTGTLAEVFGLAEDTTSGAE